MFYPQNQTHLRITTLLGVLIFPSAVFLKVLRFLTALFHPPSIRRLPPPDDIEDTYHCPKALPDHATASDACYAIVNEPRTFSEAVDYCHGLHPQAHVASFHYSGTEKDLLGLNLLSVNHSYWFGLYKVSNIYLWIDSGSVQHVQRPTGLMRSRHWRLRDCFKMNVTSKTVRWMAINSLEYFIRCAFRFPSSGGVFFCFCFAAFGLATAATRVESGSSWMHESCSAKLPFICQAYVWGRAPTTNTSRASTLPASYPALSCPPQYRQHEDRCFKASSLPLRYFPRQQ
ncbi:unnamed protein product [Dibothriocephalus latus]|uniref:C-type lectin domain-containing protein n=1 Tax=Dibothriocephalus latus TaxID=60516 RepID=A0A3P7KW19_DIBLA|nr:unnamed protein product [Dibothriocephalus latus]